MPTIKDITSEACKIHNDLGLTPNELLRERNQLLADIKKIQITVLRHINNIEGLLK